MTMWLPDPNLIRRPAYLSLADQFARAIGEGRLAAGARLPTHRGLAEMLNLSVQTVSRAYEELIRRGLVTGEIGRGSFVQARQHDLDPPYMPERVGEVIDLSILKPVCDAIHIERMRRTFGRLSELAPPSAILSFRPNMVFPRHRSTAVEWLKQCGLAVAPSNITLTNGATPGVTVALITVARPGSVIATEAIGLHTLMPLATYLGVTLEGLPIDEEGIIPEALDAACRHELTLRAVFVQPSVGNPTATLMSGDRREAIATVARKHNIAIVEDDVLGPLVENRAPPIAFFAPERTLYITSFTKCVVPGLRIGYLVVPDPYAAAVASRHLVSNWMATPMMAEIASRWVQDGTAMELIAWQRAALMRRQRIIADVLTDARYLTHPQALHAWLPLPAQWTEERFVAHARLLGVAIASGEAFRIAQEGSQPAIRISLGSSSEEELRSGLDIIAKLLVSDPEHLLLAI